MTTTISTVDLKICQRQCVVLPELAQILAIKRQATRQGQGLRLWAHAAKDAPTEARHIRMYGTGEDIPEGEVLTHLASVPLSSGKVVMHVFEVLDSADMNRI